MLNLPNSLTLIRILAIPFFLVLLSSRLYLEALAVFVVGGVTDALDGAVARLMSQQTWLGAYLDPVADKLLVISSFVMLGLIGAIPPWFGVLIISRDAINTVADDLLVADTLLFFASCLLSYWALRARSAGRMRSVERAADLIFIVGLILMAVVCGIITYGIA